jgi:hypothetical protein
MKFEFEFSLPEIKHLPSEQGAKLVEGCLCSPEMLEMKTRQSRRSGFLRIVLVLIGVPLAGVCAWFDLGLVRMTLLVFTVLFIIGLQEAFHARARIKLLRLLLERQSLTIK